MTTRRSISDVGDYPWDAVWEYILDDRNFEEREPEQNVWQRKLAEARKNRNGHQEVEDIDSAYADAEEIRQTNDLKTRVGELNPKEPHGKSNQQPKRSKRFAWLRRRRKDKRVEQKEKQAPRVTRIEPTVSKPRAQLRKVKRRHSERNEKEESFSDFGPSFFNKRLEDDADDAFSVTPSVASENGSVFESLLPWGNFNKEPRMPEDVSSLGETSVNSHQPGSPLHLMSWGKTAHDAANGDDLSQVLGRDEDSSDEVSVMKSIFQVEETRSDFEAIDREHHRNQAKQKWRNKVTRQRGEEHSTGNHPTTLRPTGLRRSLSDLFDGRELESVNSSRSRRSRSSKQGSKARKPSRNPGQVLLADDISVASYLLETQGGFLMHVPSAIAVAPSNSTRRRRPMPNY